MKVDHNHRRLLTLYPMDGPIGLAAPPDRHRILVTCARPADERKSDIAQQQFTRERLVGFVYPMLWKKSAFGRSAPPLTWREVRS